MDQTGLLSTYKISCAIVLSPLAFTTRTSYGSSAEFKSLVFTVIESSELFTNVVLTGTMSAFPFPGTSLTYVPESKLFPVMVIDCVLATSVVLMCVGEMPMISGG